MRDDRSGTDESAGEEPLPLEYARCEPWAAWLLGGPLTALVLLACVVLLLGWVPHYLTWPWWPDLDAFANQALAWEKGILPYRDIQGWNFPGQTYMFYALGHLFGWGKTWPLYALDAGLVVTLGVVLMAWSRRISGWALPGAIGFLMFLLYYLRLNYLSVAQREWHATFLVALALLIPQAWPGRGGRLVSALLAACSATFRPHVVVFGPALLLAIEQGGRRPGEPLGKGIRAVVEWVFAFAVFLVLVYMPLMLAGVFDDFLRAVYTAVTQDYTERSDPREVFFNQLLQDPIRTTYLPCAVLLLAMTSSAREQRLALTWIVAFFGATLYAPLHPIPHSYLKHVLALVLAINGSVLVLLLLRSPVFGSATARLVALVLVAPGLISVNPNPLYFSPNASLRAVRSLAAGEMPRSAPPGYADSPHESLPVTAYYPWADYRAAIEYIRAETAPETRVANVLKGYQAINGPTARLSVFSTEAGILRAWQYHPRWEELLTEELERTPNSVVVWDPGKPYVNPKQHRIDIMTPVIERLYEPAAKFGDIEIWRRKPAT